MQKFLLVLAALLYFLFPYDVLPDILAGWGWIDDLIVLFFIYKLLKRFKSIDTPGEGGQQRHQTHANDDRNRAHRDKDPITETPYEILGVSENATPEEIKQAYRKLANQYHPDKVAHLGKEFQTLAEKRFKEITNAYQILTGK